YTRHRHYVPELGVFTCSDPIGLRSGHDLYEYGANPWLWVDPIGLSCRRKPKGKLYRYVGEQEADVIRRTGKIPNVDRFGKPNDIHLSRREYQTAGRAKPHNQLPVKPSHRVEVASAAVPKRSPASRVEPSANPQWGRGGGVETTTSDAIAVDRSTLVKLKG